MKATSDEVIALSGASAVLAALGGTIIGLILAFAGTDDIIRIHIDDELGGKFAA